MGGIFSGLQKIVNVIQTLVNGIKMGIQFLINLVKSMIDLVQLLTTTVTNTTTLIATLPTWLIAFATATLGVAILYMIIGRQTGKND